MEMTKEEFVHASRMASEDPQSDEGIVMYNFLVRCFTDADKDCSGTVTFDEFDTMIDKAAALPRRHGFAPTNEQSYPTPQHRIRARKVLFAEIDTANTGRISLEAWVHFAMKHISGKVRGLKPHILVDGSKSEFLSFIKKAVQKGTTEHKELYFYLLKVFQQADRDHDGAVNIAEFDKMIEIAAAMPRKYGLAPKSELMYKTEADRLAARKVQFARMDKNGDGTVSFHEWLNYAVSHIARKIADMSSSLDMPKEEFLHFISQACKHRDSNERIELHAFLVRCFTDADINYTGTVNVDEFDRMIDAAAELPRRYGLAPTNEQSYPTIEDRLKARKELFAKIDTKRTGQISLDSWISYAMTHIMGKISAVKPHIMVDGPKDEFIAFCKKAVVQKNIEHRELYFYLMKVFQQADRDHDGAVNVKEFDSMIEIAAAMPRRYGLAPQSSVMYKTDQERIAARKTQFSKMDKNNDGTISFEEWFHYAVEHIAQKVARL